MLQPTAPWPGPNATVWVAAEGHMGANGAPDDVFELPFELLLPQRAQASNLLVPVAVSASHAAYSAVRLEPQWMMLGEAAGVAAALALVRGCAVQDVPIDALQAALVAQGAHASVAALHESRDQPATQAYLADLGAMHKIVLAAPSAEAIEGVAAALRGASLGARVWVEQPEMVVTALATAPARRSVLAAFFQGLKLLR
jgi:peptidyl-tRNA hydrolase